MQANNYIIQRREGDNFQASGIKQNIHRTQKGENEEDIRYKSCFKTERQNATWV